MANAFVWSLPTIAENDATACSVSMELNSQDSGACIFFKEMNKRSSLLNQKALKVNEETVIEDSTTCYWSLYTYIGRTL